MSYNVKTFYIIYNEDCYFLSSMEKWKFSKSFEGTMKKNLSCLKTQKRLSLLNVSKNYQKNTT